MLLIFTMIAAVGLSTGLAAGQGKAQNRLEKTASDVIAATLNYRAALERVLAIYERDLARRNEQAELRQDLYERGVLSRREFEDGEKARAEARRNVLETRAALDPSGSSRCWRC